MNHIRFVAAGAALSVAAGSALMAAPARAAEPAPAPTAPKADTSKHPVKIDRDCLKKYREDRAPVEKQISQLLLKKGLAVTADVALKSAKDIVVLVIENPALLDDPDALSAEVAKIVAMNAATHITDVLGDDELKPLVEKIIDNLSESKVCYTVTRPGHNKPTTKAAHLGDYNKAGFLANLEARAP